MARLKPSKPLEPVKLKVKKGDTVEIISGKDKGKRGKVNHSMSGFLACQETLPSDLVRRSVSRHP